MCYTLLPPYNTLLTPNLQQPSNSAPTSYIQAHKGHYVLATNSRAPKHLLPMPTTHFPSNQGSNYPPRAPKGTPNLSKPLNPWSTRS